MKISYHDGGDTDPSVILASVLFSLYLLERSETADSEDARFLSFDIEETRKRDYTGRLFICKQCHYLLGKVACKFRGAG